MPLLPAYFTTNNMKKRPKAAKTAALRAAEAEHAAFLRKMGISSRGKSGKQVVKYTPAPPPPTRSIAQIPVGVAAKAAQKVYSGERKLLGIATMHKSNMVPVFSDADAKDIAKMRRG